GCHVFAADRNQKGVESTRRLGGFPVLLQEFSEDDVSHPEPDAREIDPGDLLDQGVVSAASTDRPQRPLAIEQLEPEPTIAGTPAHDAEVDRNEVSETDRADPRPAP